MDLLDQILDEAGIWLGICEECHQTKTFHSERERDLWFKFHPHDAGDGA